jgi:hypothetical protein
MRTLMSFLYAISWMLNKLQNPKVAGPDGLRLRACPDNEG